MKYVDLFMNNISVYQIKKYFNEKLKKHTHNLRIIMYRDFCESCETEINEKLTKNKMLNILHYSITLELEFSNRYFTGKAEPLDMNRI